MRLVCCLSVPFIPIEIARLSWGEGGRKRGEMNKMQEETRVRTECLRKKNFDNILLMFQTLVLCMYVTNRSNAFLKVWL